MRATSILAIYVLFWALSFFLVLPFRLRGRTGEEAYVPGQADSAPQRFSFARTSLWTTLVAAVLFGAYYVIYTRGLIDPAMFDIAAGR